MVDRATIGSRRVARRCYCPPVPLDVRPIRADELVPFVEAISTGFLDRRRDVWDFADEVSKHWDLSRASAAVEDGRIVGTFRSWAAA